MTDRRTLPRAADRLAASLAPALAAAVRGGNPVGAADLPDLGGAVAAAIAADPALRHAVNGEPWYRSRVTWGAIIAGLAPVIGLLAGHEIGEDERSLFVDIAMAAGSLAGALIALHGRWIARVPLGR